MNEIFMYALMLNLLIVVHAQFVIVLIELQKLLSQELKCLRTRLPHSYGNELYQKVMMWVCYIFIELDINILCRNVCILKCEYAVYTVLLIQYIHTL